MDLLEGEKLPSPRVDGPPKGENSINSIKVDGPTRGLKILVHKMDDPLEGKICNKFSKWTDPLEGETSPEGENF